MDARHAENKAKLREITTHYLTVGEAGRWKISLVSKNEDTGDYEILGGGETDNGFVHFVITVVDGKYVVNGKRRNKYSQYNSYICSLDTYTCEHVQILYAHLNRITEFLGGEETPYFPPAPPLRDTEP